MLRSSARGLMGVGLAAAVYFSPAWAAEIEPIPTPPAKIGVLNWDTGANQSYLIPAFEIPFFLGALNLYDRHVYGREVYGSTVDTTTSHAPPKSWEFDEDPFNINQFSHPYLGATMHAIAPTSRLRSSATAAFAPTSTISWMSARARRWPSSPRIS
jgi:hypothetical protein